MSLIGKVLSKLIGEIHTEIEEEIDVNDVQQRYKIRGKRVLMKFVDKNGDTLWQNGYLSKRNTTVELPGLTNNTADIVVWFQPIVCLALIKGKIKRKGGVEFSYDLKSALLLKEVKLWSREPTIGDMKTALNIWEDKKDKIAAMLIRRGILSESDFDENIIKNLKEKGLI